MSAFLARLSFAPLLDRHGRPARSVDAALRPAQSNMNLELGTRLDSHELIVQFMALSL